MSTKRFLQLLTGRENPVVAWRILPEGGGKPSLTTGTHQDLDHKLRVLNHGRHGIFVVVQETDLQGQRKENITNLRAVFIDIDTPALPSEWHAPPHMVVKSGRGHHAYWLIEEDTPLGLFKGAQKYLADLYNSDPQVCDLTRVMRVPGYNWCKEEEPRPVELIHTDNRPRYRLKEVAEVPMVDVAMARAEYWATRMLNADEGERNATLNKAAFELKDYLALVPEEKLLKGVKEAAWGRGVGDEEVDRTIASAKSAPEVSPAAKEFMTAEQIPLSSTNEVDLAEYYRMRHPGLINIGGQMFRWGGRVWEPVSQQLLRSLVCDYFHDHKVVQPDGTAKNLKLSMAKIKAIAELVMLHVDEGPEYWDQGPHGYALENGFLHLDGTLVPHDPSQRARFLLPITWDPEATCEHWLDFLESCHPKNEDVHLLLAEFVGVALMGKSTEFNKILFLQGQGANGKSIFLDTIRLLFPRECVTAVPIESWGREYNVALLRGSLLNLVGEVRYSLLESAAVKTIVGGEDIMGRAPYEQPQTFRPRAGHVFSVNELPPNSDATRGFWRRVLVVHWPMTFEPGSPGWIPTPDLLRRLKAELPGILRWAMIGGAHALETRSYTVPKSAIDIAEEWRVDNDPVASFIQDHPLTEEWVQGSDLYRTYSQWSHDERRPPLGRNRFYKRLRANGVVHKRAQNGWEFRSD